jgi:hypothetical protein
LDRRPPEGQPEPDSDRYIGYAVALLLLITMLVLCLAGFVIARTIMSDSPLSFLSSRDNQTPPGAPTAQVAQPTQPGARSSTGQVRIVPNLGYIGTLVSVTGQGWWPGEPVFVFLRAEGEGDGPAYAYAASVATEGGTFETAFTFPNEIRWTNAQAADIVARGSRSGLEARERFTILAPTPTHTPLSPTALPTSPPTVTPSLTDTPTAPADTATPVQTATPVVITDWRGEYFANISLESNPVLVRNDGVVDFFWNTDSPAPELPVDGFSARWTRSWPFEEGLYRFTFAADDGVRVWIDEQLYVDDWQDGPFEPQSFEVKLSEGEHALQLEYYENKGQAGALFTWKKMAVPTSTPTSTDTPLPSDTPTTTATPTRTATPEPSNTPTATLVPSSTPTPTPEPTDTPAATPTSPPELSDSWLAEYYANPNLSGEPVLVQEDAPNGDMGLSFNWADGSPGLGIPADNFSARWTRQVYMPAGTYRVYLEADDGARVWLDNQLLIDAWHVTVGETYTNEVGISNGVHTLTIEYFEAFLDARVNVQIEPVVQ